MIQSSELHIGNKLRYLIEARGLSKREVAHQLETTEQNLHKILNKDSIQINQLMKFCHILKVRPEIFFIEKKTGEEVDILKEDLPKYPGSQELMSGNVSEVMLLFRDLIAEKNKRISELQDHIDSLKTMLK